ncbi:MAG: hypothetical protein HOH77_17525 [Candidatus Latescibacteria bacterium]|nr:hypothetical protein [Candidatus Latescibacterota bacterium]
MSAKKNNPKIVDIQSRLDATVFLNELYTVFFRAGAEINEAQKVLAEACDQIGEEALIVELCRKLTTLENDNTSYLVWALEEIGGPQTVQHLQRIVDAPQTRHNIRMDAAYVLTMLGQPVEGLQIKAQLSEGFQSLLNEAEETLSKVAPEERVFALIELLNSLEAGVGAQNSAELYAALIAGLQAETHPLAADLLWVLGMFRASEEIQQSAKQALLKSQQTPTESMVDGIGKCRFDRGYYADDHKTDPSQGQILVSAKLSSGHYILFSFLIDYAFWGGGVKDFSVFPNQSQEDIQDIVSQFDMGVLEIRQIDATQTQKRIREALQANAQHNRPIPSAYRGYHQMVVQVIFDGEPFIELPSLYDEAQSPLSGKAGQVENLIQSAMQEAAFSPAQITNARMLWRDFFQTENPTIRKPEVWAASVDYVIGLLEGQADQTQQTTAKRYGVSAASISQRYFDIYGDFLNFQNGAIAYKTDKALVSFDPSDLLDLIDEDMLSDFFDEGDEPDYEGYLAAYQGHGKGRPKLSKEELEEYMLEFGVLYENEDDLNPEQKARMKELAHVLLFDLDDLI